MARSNVDFPAPVRADHRGDRAVDDVEVQSVDHDVVAVGESQVACLDPVVVVLG